MAEEIIIGLGNAYIGGGGVTPTGSIDITENGTYDVTEYASASVDVPGLVPTGTKYIYANGTDIDVAEYAKAYVAVPDQVATIIFDADGAEGTVPPPMLAPLYSASVGGVTHTLVRFPDPKQLTPPSGKHFVGWSKFTGDTGLTVLQQWKAVHEGGEQTWYAIWSDNDDLQPIDNTPTQ